MIGSCAPDPTGRFRTPPAREPKYLYAASWGEDGEKLLFEGCSQDGRFATREYGIIRLVGKFGEGGVRAMVDRWDRLWEAYNDVKNGGIYVRKLAPNCYAWEPAVLVTGDDYGVPSIGKLARGIIYVSAIPSGASVPDTFYSLDYGETWVKMT